MRRKLIPQPTRSTGRKSEKPTAHLGANGMLSLNVAAARLLGEPEKVLVEVDTSTKTFYLQPTTPADQGGWSLSGGGNTTYRVRLSAYADEFTKAVMHGEYIVIKEARAVVLRKATEGK